MQSDVSHSHGKVDVSAAVGGGHYKHVTANQDGRIRAVEWLGSRGCLCLSAVSPLQLSRPSSMGTNTGGADKLNAREREQSIKRSSVLVNGLIR